MPKRTILAGYLRFLWAGLAKHPQTGGFLPSQRFLVKAMLAPIPKDYRGRIVELGTGNGTLTRRLAARCPQARILACEINPVLAQDTRHNLARDGVDGRVEVFTRPALDLLEELIPQQQAKPGYVVSGLPLGNWDKTVVLALVQAIRCSLADDGMFIQFQHSLLDRGHIRTAFPRLRVRPVLLNLPPAFVYFAQK